MRSIRLRFFLISWPLVVAAVGGVAWTFDRWAAVELRVLEESVTADRDSPESMARREAIVGAVARWWTDGASVPLAEAVAAAGEDVPGAVVLVADDGSVTATTAAGVRVVEPPDAEGVALLDWSVRSGGVVRDSRLRLVGTRLGGPSGPSVYVLPAPAEDGLPTLPDAVGRLRADARRTLLTSVLAASAVAAALSLLLARPVVDQIGRLAVASDAVRHGDLTTRVRPEGEDELARLERSFNAMAEELERADRHKRNLVTDVAHELRTPLTNVVGMVEAMQDGLMARDSVTLSALAREVALLTELVADLQDLSLAESGQIPFALERVDVADEARAAVRAARAAGPGPVLDGPPDEQHEYAVADRRRLGQVVRNLIRNALTHTGSDGRVTVTVSPGDDAVVLSVEDTGSGIPGDHLDRIWERFHRVDGSRDRASGGRGLGLAIVRHLVEGMDGSVTVTSEEGRGSCFRVRLPAAR